MKFYWDHFLCETPVLTTDLPQAKQGTGCVSVLSHDLNFVLEMLLADVTAKTVFPCVCAAKFLPVVYEELSFLCNFDMLPFKITSNYPIISCVLERSVTALPGDAADLKQRSFECCGSLFLELTNRLLVEWISKFAQVLFGFSREITHWRSPYARMKLIPSRTSCTAFNFPMSYIL